MRRLLAPGGSFCCVLPDAESVALQNLAPCHALRVDRQVLVRTRPDREVRRRVVWMSAADEPPASGPSVSEVSLYDTRFDPSQRGTPCSSWYVALTADLYTSTPR